MADLHVGSLCVVGLTLLTSATASATAMTCPAKLPAAHAGFEQVGPTPPSAHPLTGMRLFDGPPGEETKAAPAELAPDSVLKLPNGLRSTWRFAGDEALLAICVYQATQTYYRLRLQPLPRACTLERRPDHVLAGCE